MSQKAENLLNLALDATSEEREKSLELEVGYQPLDQEWDLIIKYSGNLEAVREIASSVTEERFQKIAEMLENGTYYSREEQGRWICTNCGYIHDGKQAPSVCPVCRHEKGYFLPYEYAPYKGAGK